MTCLQLLDFTAISSYFLRTQLHFWPSLVNLFSLLYIKITSRRKFSISIAGNINFWILLPGRKTIYPGLVVFIRSSKVWFKTVSCAKGAVTRCNFPGNLQRNSTLKRCKLVTNVCHVKNIFAKCDGNVYLPILHIRRVE